VISADQLATALQGDLRPSTFAASALRAKRMTATETLAHDLLALVQPND
jgi:hypothetical protein